MGMTRFERIHFLLDADTGIFAVKGFRRPSSRSFYRQPHVAQLKDHLWILLRVALIIATVGLIALVAHGG